MNPLSEKDLIDLSLWVENHGDKAVTRFLKFSSLERSELASHARVLSQVKPEHRAILRYLLAAIKESDELSPYVPIAIEERRREITDWQNNLASRAELAMFHPKGALIESTPIQGYKVPGAKVHWGTKRKKKP